MKAIADPQSKIDQKEFAEFLECKKREDRGISIANLKGSDLQPLPFFGNLPLDVNHQEEGGLCIMAREGIGQIKPRGQCQCGQKFEEIKTNVGRILACKSCLAKGQINIPKRYFIELRWDNDRVRIFSDNNGDVLSNITRANDLITEIRQKIKKNEFSPDQYRAQDYRKLQFDRYARDWLADYKQLLEKGQVAPTYEYKIRGIVNKYLIPRFGSKDMRKFIKKDVDKFYLSLDKELSIGTQKNIVASLKQIFLNALDGGAIRPEQMPPFPKIKLDEPETNWLNEEEQDIIYKKIPDVHKPLFFFIMHTGCRCGEARALQAEDINWDNRTVTICRTISLGYLRHKTKGKKDRTLPIDDELYEMLKQNRKITGYVFTHVNGNYYKAI